MPDWGSAAGGAATGAAAGAALGPWGALGGGIIGGLGGLFGSSRPGQAENDALRKAQLAEYNRLGGALDQQAAYMQRIARGEESVSAEQLRQGLQQNISAQQSMAAGAAPRNSAMAGLMASRNAMNLGAGMAGQQAMAGIQERQAAQNALSQMLLQQRGQAVQAGSSGFGQAPVQPSWLERYGQPIAAGATLYAQTHGRGGQDGQQKGAAQPSRSGPQGNGVYNPTWNY